MFRECYVARMPEWEHRRGLPSKMAAIRAMCTRGHHLIARNFEKVTEYTYTRCTTTFLRVLLVSHARMGAWMGPE